MRTFCIFRYLMVRRVRIRILFRMGGIDLQNKYRISNRRMSNVEVGSFNLGSYFRVRHLNFNIRNSIRIYTSKPVMYKPPGRWYRWRPFGTTFYGLMADL